MADLVPVHGGEELTVSATSAPSPAAVYLAGLQGPASRTTMRAALDRILRLLRANVAIEVFPWHQLRHEHVSAIRAQLAERAAPATAQLSLSALRGVLRSAWRLGLLDSDGYQRAVDIPPIRGSRVKGRHVSPADIRQLFAACDAAKDKWLGARNAAVVALLFGAGLRRSEAVELDIDDIDLETGQVKVLGKGNKERLTYLPEGSLDAIQVWIDIRTQTGIQSIRGRRTTALVPQTSALLLSGKHGHNHRRMTPGGILFALNAAAKKAGIKPFTPHDLRRTFIGELLDAGADLASIQNMVGHSSPTTTSRYDRRGERAKKKSASLLHVPYSKP